MTGQEGWIIFAAGGVAGAVNSVAGGGTLLTFPALLALGQPAIVANATSTVALWPGQVSSLWGYRKEIGQTRATVVPLTLLGIAGGIVGAVLLLLTPSNVFDRIVPFLVLLATLLFMAQEPIARWQKKRTESLLDTSAVREPTLPVHMPATTSAVHSIVVSETLVAERVSTDAPSFNHFSAAIVLLALGIAVYGGYFGAGIGILTLATLGFLGFRNIHQMNGIKSIYTLGINGVAALIFIAKHLVDWKIAALMAAGAIIGGYAGAGTARRIGQQNVRRLVIAIGLLLTLSLLHRSGQSATAAPVEPASSGTKGSK